MSPIIPVVIPPIMFIVVVGAIVWTSVQKLSKIIREPAKYFMSNKFSRKFSKII